MTIFFTAEIFYPLLSRKKEYEKGAFFGPYE